MPGIGMGWSILVGCPHEVSQPVICSISGACAFSILAASSFTLGSDAFVLAYLAISTACWWCGIIAWANIASAELKLPDAAPALAPDLPPEWSMPAMLLSLPPPQ